jgi:hypothetical protein
LHGADAFTYAAFGAFFFGFVNVKQGRPFERFETIRRRQRNTSWAEAAPKPPENERADEGNGDEEVN